MPGAERFSAYGGGRKWGGLLDVDLGLAPQHAHRGVHAFHICPAIALDPAPQPDGPGLSCNRGGQQCRSSSMTARDDPRQSRD